MKIDKRFWTYRAKERLRFIKSKWKSLSNSSKETMPYKKFRNAFLNEVGKVRKTREKLVQIISDKQLQDAKKFFNNRRKNNGIIQL